ncbi:MAG: phosphatidylserine decarboxylase family protein [Candidatus Nealsonbacteria bacterium]|nr:phosphatidylserine decarboxylase family protein [Candidatus Nealsonbacteria bacterium]
MSIADTPTNRAIPEPLPDSFCGVQPGGGVCYRIELAWGRWRRWYLKRFRQGYVRRMAQLRSGDCDGAPHEILDPRDLKYCRNQCRCDWAPTDDPFAWRERLPFARWGLAELQLMGWPMAALTVVAACTPMWYLAVVPGVLLGLIVYFFRDPPRRVPQDPGLIVSPADGKIAEIVELEHDELVGGPAVRIGIFLSIFNVHLNRAPSESRVIALQYRPGEFLNALNPESAIRNENTRIVLEEEAPPHRRIVVRQISGAIARRIVCGLRPGELVARGAKFGMIKLGSRTELILPKTDGLKIEVEVGRKVKAGSTVMGRWGG